ncbi:cytochrome c [Pseudoruegeria sp. HB172150]|uniref:c-type cytochrome n=1 Tax=Pseudoruegeria sp. HB172150 TaxID=2721164 RepID=UPI001553A732|nr:cytochrome c [Pseudoruegeria sp. HB172150]
MRAVSLFFAMSGVLALGACTNEVETGRASFADLCAGCHGETGQGNGPMVANLTTKPADLTRISARNGGTFPRVDVMSKIYGYARGEAHGGAMPAFWPLLDGPTVLVETGDGILTPTPEPLVALTSYLESIQQ